MSPRHAVAVLRSLEALLAGTPDVPHDVHAATEVLVDVAIGTGCGVADEAARATLERIGASSTGAKRSKLAAAALAAPVDDRARSTHRWDGLDAQLDRAERWAAPLA